MQLHELKPVHRIKSKKRIGRGGKRGTYSGRGQKGQKSRAGAKIRPAERDLIMRLPKLKGLKNKSLKLKPRVINVGDLEKKVEGAIINKDALVKSGLAKKTDKVIKLLGDGEVKKAFTVEGVSLSKQAKAKIESAGGHVK